MKARIPGGVTVEGVIVTEDASGPIEGDPLAKWMIVEDDGGERFDVRADEVDDITKLG